MKTDLLKNMLLLKIENENKAIKKSIIIYVTFTSTFVICIWNTGQGARSQMRILPGVPDVSGQDLPVCHVG